MRKGLKSIRLITEPIFILRDFLEGVVASPQESTVPSHLVVEGADQVNKLPGVAKFHRNLPSIYIYIYVLLQRKSIPFSCKNIQLCGVAGYALLRLFANKHSRIVLLLLHQI